MREVLPSCPKCRTQMVLKRVHAGKHYDYVGKFACATCNRTVTETLVLTSSPPLAPASVEQNQPNYKAAQCE
jgi:transposase-like protein